MIPATDGPLEGSAMNIGYNNIIKVFTDLQNYLSHHMTHIKT